MDKVGIFVLSQEEVEFLEFMAEVSRVANVLPMPAIYSGCNVEESSNTFESEARVDGVDAELIISIIPILRHVENLIVLQLYTKSRVADKSSTSLFTCEITESHLPRIPLCLGNSIKLANALHKFFGGSGTAQIKFLGCESSILDEVEPPTEIIMERITDSLLAYEPMDEALQSQQSTCTSTLEVICSYYTAKSEGDGIETMAEIKPVEEPEEWTNIQRKSFFKLLGRRLLKIGRRLCLCCCYCSKLD
ncbi:hypothetical protein FWK35_00027009 [Aphis craccivora]|uniref:Uncharacterized protein n=1 Tax=Aphis craccivora TaxID=307492 RepID=A0A6G0YT14_APHCR|nr:hypothetical protein FWK35_00027009 [Aphis craccivora]